MRKRIFGLCANSGIALCLFLLVASINFPIGKAESDFADADDGIVEDIQEDASNTVEQLEYESPRYDPKQFHFVDHFDNVEESRKRWVKSQAKKDDIAEEIAKYDGLWQWEAPQRIVPKKDIGLVLKSKAKHHAIAAKLDKMFTFKEDKPLVVQYEVTMQEGQDCGGSYIKLLSAGRLTEDLTKFNDKTPYTIMFGPDKCGNDVKMHFIFRHVNPINGTISEKHAQKPKDRLEEPFKDKLPHLYQLVVRPDNTFEIRVDHKVVNEGSLLSDFTPPVNPPREIDDPEDIKPKDWDDREKIPDPTAHKPEDWDEDAPPQIPDPTAEKPDGWLEDEPDMIPDPNASKPDDWDSEIDGEWEAPLVDNPVCESAVGCGKWKAPLISNKDYKGKWRAPMIDNPNYRGKWAPRKIPNPDYYEDLTPFKMTPISAIGLELWSMSNEILFDNLVITDDIEVARDYAAKTFDIKRQYIDKESKTLWHRLMRHMNYKPGWWALYFLYLLIPASCYVYYLYRRAKEDTFLNVFFKYLKENPWTLRISVVVVATLLAYLFYRVVSNRGKKAEESSTDTDSKKTDAVQADDISSSDATATAGAQGDNEQNYDSTSRDGSIPKGTKSSPKQKKSDLDVEENSAEQEESGEGDGEETEESTSKPRKRRVRKDQA